MSEDQSATFANEAQYKADKRRRKINEFKSLIRIAFHAIFWKSLWKTGLAVPYSRFMCKQGWYEKFLDGRCMYCGKVHLVPPRG